MKISQQGDNFLISPESYDEAKICQYIGVRTPWVFSWPAQAWRVPIWAFSGLPANLSRRPLPPKPRKEPPLNPFHILSLPDHVKPYPFQRTQIANLLSGPWGLWADAGTGKTLTSLSAYYVLRKLNLVDGAIVIGPENGRHVWVGPDSDSNKWIGEIGVYVEKDLDPNLANPLPVEGLIYTTAAKIFRAPYNQWIGERVRSKRFVLILDEVQLLVGPLTKRLNTLLSWARNCRYRWLLSATPTGNYPDSFWGVYKLLTLSDVEFDQWVKWFRVGTKTGSASRWHKHRLQSLGDYLGYCTSVVKKADVANWLPPVTSRTIKIPLTGKQKELYAALIGESKEALSGKIASQREAGRKDYKHQLIYLQSMASHPLVSKAEGWVDSDIAKLPALKELLSSVGDQKVCIWSWHPGVLDWLAGILGKDKCAVYHGGVSKKAKEVGVKRFNEDPSCIYFLGNPSAAGTSLNLGAGTVRIFWDLGWSWVQYHQACERINRITRTLPITSYTLISENTVEEVMLRAIGKKKELASLITDGAGTAEESAMLAEVLGMWS